MKLYYKIILFSIVTSTIFLAKPVFAAIIFFGAHSKSVGVGDTFEIGVFVDTQGQPVNAVEGQIAFDRGAFASRGFYNGNSILSFWVKPPALASDGTVSFSGIVPGGFTGGKGYLFSLVLQAKEQGNFAISASNEKILLNDGNGTEATLTQAPLDLTVVQKTSLPVFTPPSDTTPPETFEPTVGKDLNIFSGKYFLAFVAQDKSSGIDHYEVMETGQIGSFASLFSKSNWMAAQSPYLLQDQTLQSVILVKAVDKAGNERTVKVEPQNALPWYENYFIWGIMAVLSIIFIGYRLWKKRQL